MMRKIRYLIPLLLALFIVFNAVSTAQALQETPDGDTNNSDEGNLWNDLFDSIFGDGAWGDGNYADITDGDSDDGDVTDGDSDDGEINDETSENDEGEDVDDGEDQVDDGTNEGNEGNEEAEQ